MNERLAAIDIGTNSALLLIAESHGGVLEPLLQRIAVPRLGRNLVRTGLISEESFQALLLALRSFQQEIEKFGAKLVGTVATQAFRTASNGAVLIEKISLLLGLGTRILSGSDESRLSYLAVANRHPKTNLAVLDIGGGSIELHRLGQDWSLPLGAVSLMEACGNSSVACRKKALTAFDEVMPSGPGPMDLIVVGGTAAALAMLELRLPAFDSAAIEGLQIGVTQVTAKIDLLTRLSQIERAELPGMELSRMDILVPGLCLLERFLQKANCSHFSVSDRGVRYGVILEWLEQRASQNRPVLP